MEKRHIVKDATEAFSSGQFRTALNLYLKAAEKYGPTLFEANIKFCKTRLADKQEVEPKQVTRPAITVEEQLAQTQELLEYYFIRSQELEYQLLAK